MFMPDPRTYDLTPSRSRVVKVEDPLRRRYVLSNWEGVLSFALRLRTVRILQYGIGIERARRTDLNADCEIDVNVTRVMCQQNGNTPVNQSANLVSLTVIPAILMDVRTLPEEEKKDQSDGSSEERQGVLRHIALVENYHPDENKFARCMADWSTYSASEDADPLIKEFADIIALQEGGVDASVAQKVAYLRAWKGRIGAIDMNAATENWALINEFGTPWDSANYHEIFGASWRFGARALAHVMGLPRVGAGTAEMAMAMLQLYAKKYGLMVTGGIVGVASMAFLLKWLMMYFIKNETSDRVLNDLVGRLLELEEAGDASLSNGDDWQQVARDYRGKFEDGVHGSVDSIFANVWSGDTALLGTKEDPSEFYRTLVHRLMEFELEYKNEFVGSGLSETTTRDAITLHLTSLPGYTSNSTQGDYLPRPLLTEALDQIGKAGPKILNQVSYVWSRRKKVEINSLINTYKKMNGEQIIEDINRAYTNTVESKLNGIKTVEDYDRHVKQGMPIVTEAYRESLGVTRQAMIRKASLAAIKERLGDGIKTWDLDVEKLELPGLHMQEGDAEMPIDAEIPMREIRDAVEKTSDALLESTRNGYKRKLVDGFKRVFKETVDTQPLNQFIPEFLIPINAYDAEVDFRNLVTDAINTAGLSIKEGHNVDTIAGLIKALAEGADSKYRDPEYSSWSWYSRLWSTDDAPHPWKGELARWDILKKAGGGIGLFPRLEGGHGTDFMGQGGGLPGPRPTETAPRIT